MSGVDVTGWPRLARLSFRTSRRRLIAWPVVMGFLVFVTADAIPTLYGDAEARAGYAATAGDSVATQIFNGRGYALDTVGGITAYELGFFAMLVFPVIALHLAVHLTRTQESAGRFELLTAARLGRTAPLLSAMVVLTAVMAVTGLLVLLGLLAAGLGSGAFWYAAGIFLLLVTMAALGIVVAQVATDGQGAHGLGLLVIGVLFVVRAVVDGFALDATWLSPLGWTPEIRPFGDPQVWPLVAFAVLTTVLVVVAVVLNVRRDLDGGLLAPRAGSPTAPARYGTPAGLALRLFRGTWLGWTAATVVWAVIIGAIAREMRELFESNPDMQAMLGAEGAAPEDIMVSAGGFFVALLALGFVAHVTVRIAGEESSGRLGVLLASPMSRPTWWLGVVGTALSLGVVTLLLGGLALGIGLWIGTGDSSSVGTGLLVGSAYLTAVVLTGAVCALLAAVSPRLAGLAWAVFALVMVLDFLGDVLDLPGWVMDLSPFTHVGQPPIDDVSAMPLLVMGVLAALVLAGSVLLVRRRDLAA